MNQKGIFIWFGGLDSTIIESQIILHVKYCISLGIDFEVWCFTPTLAVYEKSIKALEGFKEHNVPIKLFKGYRYRNPLSIFLNALFLSHLLLKDPNRINFLHCRTEYAASAALLVKPFFPCEVICDVRGDTIEERKYKSSLSFFRRLLLLPDLLYLQTQKHFCKVFADKFIFVSKELEKVFLKTTRNKKKSFVIPCLASEETFFFEPNLREKMRTTLKISDDEIVLIYSGSTTKWQCIDKVIGLMDKALMRNKKIKLIVLTPDTKSFQNKLPKSFDDSRLTLKSVGINDVNMFLNAADYAIFLRESHPLNFVASPVKFAEYCLSGLSIIMNENVPQAYKNAKKLKNIINSENFALEKLKTAQAKSRSSIAIEAKKLLGREAYRNILNKIYNL